MDKLKLIELRQEAKNRGIFKYYKMRKQQLIDVLSLPEVEFVYEQSSIDERPSIETQKTIATIGGVSDKSSRCDYR